VEPSPPKMVDNGTICFSVMQRWSNERKGAEDVSPGTPWPVGLALLLRGNSEVTQLSLFSARYLNRSGKIVKNLSRDWTSLVFSCYDFTSKMGFWLKTCFQWFKAKISCWRLNGKSRMRYHHIITSQTQYYWRLF